MQAILWPNKLGYDVDSAEVWLHKDKFRGFTLDRVMLVPFAVTTNPCVAVDLCERQGLNRAELDSLEDWDAQALFLANVPTQKELF